MTPRRDGGDGRSAVPDGMSILVTGAAGFIGSHVCDRLLADGHAVWGLDSFDDFYDPARKRANLAQALRSPSMHLVEGDVRDEILLDGLMSDVPFDAVVHLAARPGVRSSLENPDLCYDVNVRGTLRVLDAMRLHDVPVLLFGSSASVYGETSEAPFAEDGAADRPISPYGASKRAGEMLCHVYHHLHGLTVYCLRLFSVYGPRQRPDLALHAFARLMTSGEPLPLYGDGSTRRDYTYIDDVVDGVALALEGARRRNGDRSAYEIVNLGSAVSLPLREVVEALGHELGISPEIERLPQHPGELSATHASVARGRELIGYSPGVSLDEGLARFTEWFRESRASEPVAPGADDRPAGPGGT